MDIEIKAAIEGIDWCYSKELIQTETLKAKYKKGTRVYIVENQTNGLSKNIKTNSGRVLIGFLPDEAIDWVTFQEAAGEAVYGVIHKVEGVFPYLKVEVKLSINPIEIPKTQKSSLLARTPIRQTKTLTPVLKSDNNKAKHPITNKAFATKSLDKFVKDNRGICGIYCIYSKEFATYIGQSVDVGGRVRKHFYELKSNKHHNTQMQNDWNEKGERFFTYHLVESCEVESLDELEALYIEKYQTYRYGYNSTPDGQGIVVVESATVTAISECNAIDKAEQANQIFPIESEEQVIDAEKKATHRNLERIETINEVISERNVSLQDSANYVANSSGSAKYVTSGRSHKGFTMYGDQRIQKEYNQILERLNQKFQDEANKLKFSDGALMLMSKNTRYFAKRRSKVLKPFRSLLLSVQTETKRFERSMDTSGLLTLQAKLKEYIEYYS
ncbi:GIY-YIG nuclease family protein [Catenovulum sediminis]|uniref:GIY-YIG nuclease family protein n=1 Tax=Catenovulum sediminis TaxID=1740262 RepID=UPI0011814D1D|nr:GIY-YIG nuclease family protein [Catenovulum sediminis]